MKLKALLSHLHIPATIEDDPVITGIASHSKKVKPGYLFFAISGVEADGHQYIQEAFENGAAAVIGEYQKISGKGLYFYAEDTKRLLSLAASYFYDEPYKKHKMTGITGTNGKTTTSFLLQHLLVSHGVSTALFGTVHHYINSNIVKSSHTTPDPVTLQHLLNESDDQAVVMEVSSHGLEQKRIEGITYDQAIFLNLTHDHLDYHGTMESYYLCKAKLFSYLKNKGTAIICSEGTYGKRLREELSRDNNLQVWTYGKRKSDHFYIEDVGKESFNLIHETLHVTVPLPLPGEYNALNTTAAIAAALDYGIPIKSSIEYLKTFEGIPGRFEELTLYNGTEVIIDYAHTPDGVLQVLEAASKKAGNRPLYHVFGFRGNRDLTKRQEMIGISLEYSTKTVLTVDDLNGVDRDQLVLETKEAIPKTSQMPIVIADRTEAIILALKEAPPNSVIIITGKGPEKYKESYHHPSDSDLATVELFQSQNKAALL
ncbi:UDP-N-acetylmuramoyl-L-alanyl-D-glutamate--2,6-diaminopimelate ligase [Fictibacillus barbaricus]|uniref:UDP-N-acetylmuramyl-tripeptide synthetase n=1 Tax=Fictibacillus barbaricus TaxID=182136 RepID=A0ABS2ZBU1_9BACL|nr:UDP-N-acetylmuramoyl-L-alanyl-D-glutamate--2,6-diaminopimelate ligase [Fictibacillus barbaricus]MBN3545669.1 UDP-N-acetylmuramoyl-L-alanyl-D-glutamate--2,6-diaminopimelate ligase [Fictibacillus barbaricus]GGB55222.1 UDP-N-acetylmuramoyl-L-alanyl-D-glutamate--2,6-diaminopimelate ligase [Fictibacillus barbaricus]